MNKQILRKEIRQLRDKINMGDLQRFNKIIYDRLISNEYIKNADVVMVYVSMGSEVDTHVLIKSLISQGKRVAVPVVNGKTLDISYISSMDDLESGSYEILEPKKSAFRRCDPSEIDVVIVPALAFDSNRHRIGYGAGFYDRLLPLTNAVKIGICYSFCMIENTFPEKHDVTVDFIISDSNTKL